MRINLWMSSAMALAMNFLGQEAIAEGTPGQMLPGGEWASGRWEGRLVSIGNANGTAALSQSPRTLIVRRDADGTVTCLWYVSNDPQSRQWTKKCKIGPRSISLETAAGSQVEMSRSGQDDLQGQLFPALLSTGASAGMGGTHVYLKRAP